MIVNPYLHFESDRIFNPTRDTALGPGDPLFAALHELRRGERAISTLDVETVSALFSQQWVISPDTDLSRTFFLKYVSIETHTVCNQRCYFCPVSIDPREAYFMPDELFSSIVQQLAAHRDTIEGVSLNQYNEPTIDSRFMEQLRLLRSHGLAPAVVTNGTGLTPEIADGIVAMGGVRYLSVNLSTVDDAQYRKERKSGHLARVLSNLRHMMDLDVAPEMEISVLGSGDDQHQRAFEEIGQMFGSSHFTVRYFEIMDRAGNLTVGLRPEQESGPLCGCEQTGSRPIQWLHVTAQGRCVLCCQDYYERYVVGDLRVETVDEILGGERMARFRRWSYGLEPAPSEFICNNCIYARRCPE